MRRFIPSKRKIVALAFFNALVCALLMKAGAFSPPPIAAPEDLAVDAIPALQTAVKVGDLTPHEALWNKPKWLYDYEEAASISRSTGRPIYLQVMSGRLDTRC